MEKAEGWRVGERRQKTEDRRQEAEDRRQKTEDRRGLEKERVQGFEDSRGRVVLLVFFFKPKEARGRKSEGAEDSRIWRSEGVEESRIQGVEWFSWYLFFKYEKRRSQGIPNQRK